MKRTMTSEYYRAERLEKGLSQMQLAVRSNISIAMIQKIEQGLREPSEELEKRLKKALRKKP